MSNFSTKPPAPVVQPLKGFRDILPEEMLAKKDMIQAIETVFCQYGFSPIQTPTIEYSDLLLGKYGEEGDKLLFRFMDNGERDVALRYDLTVPLARFLGTHTDLPLPFKRYQIGSVFRAEKPARGRFREFVQCDADIVGAPSIEADADVIATGIACLKILLHRHDVSEKRLLRQGLPAFTLRLSHRQLLNALCEKVGVHSQEAALNVLRVLDKLDKQGRDKVLQQLTTQCQLTKESVQIIFDYLDLEVSLDHLAPLAHFFSTQAQAQQAIGDLQALHELIQAYGLSEYVRVDLSIARGLDYYTGLIYETTLNGLDGFGSIMSGGRYDHLMGMFRSSQSLQTSAIGISIGLDRLLSGMQELGLLMPKKTATQVYVTIFSQQEKLTSIALAQMLRALNIATETAIHVDKIGKQIKYADKLGIPFVIIIGPDEQAQGVCKIKQLKTGQETTLAYADVGAFILSNPDVTCMAYK